ncbi:hypothetical protein K438DRAFT_2066212 [Mycena galopus ATCC 62051]|nr:hypothetical protein K438DRAFT_2066212 [Mycena galopus ATCC 62051]
MSHSAFEIPTRVPVACSNCRDRKVKTSCMRCHFNGLTCQYVATKKQQERSRNACSKASKAPRRRCTRSRKKASPPPTMSPAEPPFNSTESLRSPSGDSLDGLSPSGSIDGDKFLFSTSQWVSPTHMASSHVHPEAGIDYWLIDQPPSPLYHAPIDISHQGEPWCFPNNVRSGMYFTTAGLDPTVDRINYGYDGWENCNQTCQW